MLGTDLRAHLQFLRKEPISEKNPEERGASPWGLAGGIRIIILRRLFFHWVGPVPARFERGDVLAQSCLWSYFLSGLFLRRMGGKVIRKL
jgi:hypothetical protein